MDLQWLTPEEDLLCLWQRLLDDGYDVQALHEACLQAANAGEREQALRLMHTLSEAGMRNDYAWQEPSDYEAIRALIRSAQKQTVTRSAQQWHNHLKGAWAGKIAGCLLGKPVECMSRNDIEQIQKQTGNLPLRGYLSAPDLAQLHPQGSFVNMEMDRVSKACWFDTLRGFCPWDDDTNYTVLSLKLIQEYGVDFTPEDVLLCWLKWLPLISTCTAERVAYRNAVNGMQPPETARCLNPFSHMVGAQIRADFFGYINPGDPLRAAELAWRDASISHTGNGIYGEMFVAAMTAAALTAPTPEDVVLAGLSVVPPRSRLAADVNTILQRWRAGASWKDTVDYIHRHYDEHSFYDWCSVLPNAMIVTASLLYGADDFARSICMAVESAFDTDSTAANVGSIVGLRIGFEAIPPYWYESFGQTLQTTMPGLSLVKLDELAEQTLALLPEQERASCAK